MLLFSIMNGPENPYQLISGKLGTRFIGKKIIYVPRLSSTMDAARREAENGAPEGTVIITGEQTEGRGRLKRHWLSPPGNIAMSVILYPEVTTLPYLIMITSLAVVRSIEKVTGLKADIKWPNDILTGGKKVSGILIENEIGGGQSIRAVIGIGININLGEINIENNNLPATSLEQEIKRNVNKFDLVKCLLTEIEHLYLLLPDKGTIFGEWQGKLATLGQRVTVTMRDGTIQGIAESVDESGSLLLRHDDGMYTQIVAGEVTLREY